MSAKEKKAVSLRKYQTHRSDPQWSRREVSIANLSKTWTMSEML